MQMRVHQSDIRALGGQAGMLPGEHDLGMCVRQRRARQQKGSEGKR
jgi:hypothetical protein